MDFFQWDINPWGQNILIRISWDLLWAAVIGAILFVVFHLLYRRFWASKTSSLCTQSNPQDAPGIPERVPRHSTASRAFHWVMAASVFVLLFTGFLPVVGIQFSWVTIHWIAGLVLLLAILFHIIHASFWQDLRAVWISMTEIRNGLNRARQILGRRTPTPEKPGKYPLANKLFHHVTLLTSAGVLGTGLLMMARVETPFWTRNPYLLADQTWGLIYVLHGLAAVAFIGMVTAHVYFAVLPEKRWMTWSMILGWITRQKYLENYDPQSWAVVTETASTDDGS